MKMDMDIETNETEPQSEKKSTLCFNVVTEIGRKSCALMLPSQMTAEEAWRLHSIIDAAIEVL